MEDRPVSMENVPAKRATEFATLFQFTDDLYRANSPADVYNATFTAIERALGCDRASILRFDDAGVMRFVASRGLSDAYRKAVDGHSPWKPGDKNPDPIFIADIDAADMPEALKPPFDRKALEPLRSCP